MVTEWWMQETPVFKNYLRTINAWNRERGWLQNFCASRPSPKKTILQTRHLTYLFQDLKCVYTRPQRSRASLNYFMIRFSIVILFNNPLVKFCAVNRFLAMESSTGVWLAYQEPYLLRKLTFSSPYLTPEVIHCPLLLS